MGYLTDTLVSRRMALKCGANTIITSIHLTFGETDSDAASEIKRIQIAELAVCTETMFNYYSLTATRTVDCLQLPAEQKPTTNEMVLLDDFIFSFDMKSLNPAAALSVMHA